MDNTYDDDLVELDAKSENDFVLDAEADSKLTYEDGDLVELDAKPDDDFTLDAESDNKLIYEGDDLVEFDAISENDFVLDAKAGEFDAISENDLVLDAEANSKLTCEGDDLVEFDAISENDLVLDAEADSKLTYEDGDLVELDAKPDDDFTLDAESDNKLIYEGDDLVEFDDISENDFALDAKADSKLTCEGDDLVEFDAISENDFVLDAEVNSKLTCEGNGLVKLDARPDNDSTLDAKPNNDSILDAEANKKLLHEDLSSDDDVVILDDEDIFKETNNKKIDNEKNQLEKSSKTEPDKFSDKNFRIELGGLPRFCPLHKLKQLLNQKLHLESQDIKYSGMRKNVAYISFKDRLSKSKAMFVLNGYKWDDVTLTTQEVDRTKDPMELAKLDFLKVPKEYEQLPLTARIQKALTPYHLMPYEYQIKEKDQVLKSVLRQLGIELSRLNPDLENFIIWQKIRRKGQICEVDKFIESPVKKEYCNQCEFVIGKNRNSEIPVVGFRVADYRRDSFEIGPATHLTHLNNKMKEIVKLLEKYLETSSYEPFDPFTNKGVWRQLKVRTSNNNDVMIIITINPQEMDEKEIYDIKEDLKSFFIVGHGANGGVTSIFIQQQKEMESVKESEYEHVWGRKYIRETILGKTFQVSPDASLQVNTPACAALYKKIAEVAEIGSTSIVLDIDCGVGTLGLTLAKGCNYCLGVEMTEIGVEYAGVNAVLNGIGNALFNNGKAENYIDQMKGYQKNKVIAIVHPPKSGLSVSVMNALRTSDAINKLVYVSCDPQASLSNFQFLGSPRNRKTCKGFFFVPIRASPVDVCPGTPHFGLIVVFEKYDECRWLSIMLGTPKPEDRKYFNRIPPVSKEFECLQTKRIKRVFSSNNEEHRSRNKEKRHLDDRRRSPSPRRRRDEKYNDNERAERRLKSEKMRDRLRYRRDSLDYRRRSPSSSSRKDKRFSYEREEKHKLKSDERRDQLNEKRPSSSRSRRDERYTSSHKHEEKQKHEEKRLKREERRDLLDKKDFPPPPCISKVEWEKGGDGNRQEWKRSDQKINDGNGRFGEGSVGDVDNRFGRNRVGDGGGNFGGGSVGEGGSRFGGGGVSVGGGRYEVGDDGGISFGGGSVGDGSGNFGGGGFGDGRFGGGGVSDGRFGEGGIADGRFGGGSVGDSRFGGGDVSDGGGRFEVGCDSSGVFGGGGYWLSGGELGNGQKIAGNDDWNRRRDSEEKLPKDSQENYGEGFQEGFQACLEVLKGQVSGMIGLDNGENMTQTQKGFGNKKEMDFSMIQKESQVRSSDYSVDDILNMIKGGRSMEAGPSSLSNHSNFQDLFTHLVTLPASATNPSAALGPGYSGAWNQTGNQGSGGGGLNFSWN